VVVGVLVAVGVLEEVEVTDLVGDGVMEGVIDGELEKPSQISPEPHTDAGLPHSTEPP